MDWDLLHKYLTNEYSSEERDRVEAWLRADVENKHFLDSLKEIWGINPKDEMQVDSKSAWDTFKHNLSDSDISKINSELPKKSRRFHGLYDDSQKSRKLQRWVPVTASAVAILLLGFFMYSFMGPATTSGEVATSTEKDQTKHEIVTERGQRTLFRLSDGTRVYLNADSKIEVPRSFGDSLRRVKLEGEAYFEVTHNPEKPFLVHSGNSFTKVLGTKFGVKAYPDDQQVQVVVKEGEVALESSHIPNTERLQITKNKLGILSQEGETKLIDTPELVQYLGWKDGQLVFNATPIKEVVIQLERWYNIDIVLEDLSFYTKTMTASFKDEPMMEVLNILALSLDAELKKNDRKIIFT